MYATPEAEFISYPVGVYSLWLIFTLHFVTDSKGDNDIMDVKKMCHVQQITPVLDKPRKYVFRQPNFQKFPGEM